MSKISEKIEIIKQHHKDYPVKVIPIANSLGIKVYRAKNWPDDLSGVIKKVPVENDDKESGYAIYVNDDHHENRRRFTIAHEIAHYVLHRDKIGDGITDDAMYRSGLSDAIEQQANSLAAQILMPKKLIDKAKKDGLSSPNDLAEKFNVSLSSMNIRLNSI